MDLLIYSSYIGPENDNPWSDGIPGKRFLSICIILLILVFNLLGGDSHAGFNITSAKFRIAMIVMHMDLIKRLPGMEGEKKHNASQ